MLEYKTLMLNLVRTTRFWKTLSPGKLKVKRLESQIIITNGNRKQEHEKNLNIKNDNQNLKMIYQMPFSYILSID
jgi:hypothetical protein